MKSLQLQRDGEIILIRLYLCVSSHSVRWVDEMCCELVLEFKCATNTLHCQCIIFLVFLQFYNHIFQFLVWMNQFSLKVSLRNDRDGLCNIVSYTMTISLAIYSVCVCVSPLAATASLSLLSVCPVEQYFWFVKVSNKLNIFAELQKVKKQEPIM